MKPVIGECIYAGGLHPACDGPVTFEPHPYDYGVNGVDTPVWMCDAHRAESADSI